MGLQGVQYGRVFGDPRGIVDLADRLVRRHYVRLFGPHPPEVFDGVEHGGVVGRCGDDVMEFPIRRIGIQIRIAAVHRLDEIVETRQGLVLDDRRRQGCGFGLEQRAGLRHLEGAHRRQSLGTASVRTDENARTGLDRKLSLSLQGQLGLAHGDPADAEAIGQLTLTRQLCAWAETFGRDQLDDLFGHGME